MEWNILFALFDKILIFEDGIFCYNGKFNIFLQNIGDNM